MKLRFPKLYRYDRIREHCCAAVPFAKGELTDASCVQIKQGGEIMPVQTKATSYYEDGSIRYLFVRFLANLPANQKAELDMEFDVACRNEYQGIEIKEIQDGLVINGGLQFAVKHNDTNIFAWVEDGNRRFEKEQFRGPFLTTDEGECHGIQLGQWQVSESGPLVAVLRCMGSCTGSRNISFELKLTAYAEKPWVEIGFRLINSTKEQLPIASLIFGVMADPESIFDGRLGVSTLHNTTDETKARSGKGSSELYQTTGILELPQIQQEIDLETVRTCVATSNYKTNFVIGASGACVEKVIDAEYLLKEANEHFAEVFYGTFFADRTDETGGVCATIYQAQQNYPKAVKADESGIYVMLIPESVGNVVMEPGMSREQKFFLHFHKPEESLVELDNRSLIYQMPDRPVVSPDIFAKAGIMPDIFVDKDKVNARVELSLIGKCDNHARCYGMLNFGDSPDAGYTSQGRGKGMPVWTNNEYDFPHACALLYARTGERRFLDYMIAACSHWMDVDICHYSEDPLLQGGQWEHTHGHCKDGVIACSHEWVEGLLDCYHMTGEERALETALGIGENVLRLLETPKYQVQGENGARETGWALRTLTALYIETHDKKWIGKCEWIIGQFREWEETYGGWISVYTDNTMIRVGFMIAVAVGSLMRYYRVFPREDLKEMILRAVDDLVDNCLMETGVFYYKELPSLNRPGMNTLLLEALTIAYELTSDTRYLLCGRATFEAAVSMPASSAVSGKQIVGDAVIHKGPGTKNFAQSFLPLSVYYKAMTDNNLLK